MESNWLINIGVIYSMRLVLMSFYAICVFILSTVLPFITQNDVATFSNSFLQRIGMILVVNKIYIAIFCGVYTLIYTLLPQWVWMWIEKNWLKSKVLDRIIPELLGGDLHQHRITLFRETNYMMAVVLNYCALISHLFSQDKWKWSLYLPWPPRGRYLVVDTRCGLQYKHSFAMFRVEENEPKACDSIAAYIRYTQTSFLAQSLPDISDIDFKNIPTLRDVPKNRRKDVARYMTVGFNREFAILKRLNRRAKHFYGTTIFKEGGKPWGVLLIDSITQAPPFTDLARERFDSFSKTLSNIVSI